MATAPKKKSKERRALEKVLGNLRLTVTDAISFIQDFEEEFDKADRYYDGQTDVPPTANRSKVVATTVRDSIRAMRPSLMRVLASNRREIVKYRPSSIKQAPVTDQQTKYAHQLFWENGGYMMLFSAIDESLRHKFGPVKTSWVANPNPKYLTYTMLEQSDIAMLKSQPDITILEVRPATPPVGVVFPLALFDVDVMQAKTNGSITMEAVPYGEFFISRNARTVEDAQVHGHQRVVTVGEAKELGLDFDDWDSIPEYSDDSIESSQDNDTRRGYQLQSETSLDQGDTKKILLTEAYVRIDLHDVGFPQLYCVYLGDIGYKLLDFYRETDSPFSIIRHDPIPFTPIGYSIADVVADSQDVMTSMLRGIVDNVHLANTPRLAANPAQVNMDDLMNHKVGHPIRLKATGATVQVVAVPSQLQATLPMLQWLERDTENKVGVTKAAQGLDPDALQSTDKEAVKNTIMLSQGQVELAARNIVETGVIPIFKKLLRLSIAHLDRMQVVRTMGTLVPVDQSLLDPDMYAEPEVGLGTADEQMRMMGLQSTLDQQIKIISMLGMANPFVAAHNVYNTLEDMTVAFGLDNVGRYFNYVGVEQEQAFAKQKAEQDAAAEAAKKAADPAQAMIQMEQIKADTTRMTAIIDARTDALKLKLDALMASAKDDLERDKMSQELGLSTADMLGKYGVAVDANQIKREQAVPRVGQVDKKLDAVAVAADAGLPPVPQVPAQQPQQPSPPMGMPPQPPMGAQ